MFQTMTMDPRSLLPVAGLEPTVDLEIVRVPLTSRTILVSTDAQSVDDRESSLQGMVEHVQEHSQERDEERVRTLIIDNVIDEETMRQETRRNIRPLMVDNQYNSSAAADHLVHVPRQNQHDQHLDGRQGRIVPNRNQNDNRGHQNGRSVIDNAAIVGLRLRFLADAYDLDMKAAHNQAQQVTIYRLFL